jgi:hypothetical protein
MKRKKEVAAGWAATPSQWGWRMATPRGGRGWGTPPLNNFWGGHAPPPAPDLVFF